MIWQVSTGAEKAEAVKVNLQNDHKDTIRNSSAAAHAISDPCGIKSVKMETMETKARLHPRPLLIYLKCHRVHRASIDILEVSHGITSITCRLWWKCQSRNISSIILTILLKSSSRRLFPSATLMPIACTQRVRPSTSWLLMVSYEMWASLENVAHTNPTTMPLSWVWLRM